MLYGIVKGIKSISLLLTSIISSPDAKQFELKHASKSMYLPALEQNDPAIYQRVFYRLLEQLNLSDVPEIKAEESFCCVDGSVL